MNPEKVGYQFIPDEETNKVNKLKNNDVDQFQIGSEVLGSQGSPSSASMKKLNNVRSVSQMHS